MTEVNEEKFNLRLFVDTFKKYWSVVWSKKWYIILISAVVSGLFLLQAFMTPKTYPATLTFMINDDEGNGLSGVGAILGELGFGGNKKGHNFEKIAQIATSRKILSTLLEEKIVFQSEHDIVGNHLIELYDFPEKWSNDTILQGFKFSDSTHSSNRQVRQKDVAVEKLSRFLRGDKAGGRPGIFEVKYDDESMILAITAATQNEEFSIRLANIHYEKLSNFYIEKSIERQLKTYEHVKSKADSLRNEVESAESSLAALKDRGHGIILNSQSLPRQRLTRKVEMLYMMYAEATKNLETAEFLLKNSTPYFQVIDRPVGPIQPQGRSKKVALLKGGFIGAFLALGFFVARNWWQEQLTPSK